MAKKTIELSVGGEMVTYEQIVSRRRINSRVRELAKQLDTDYAGRTITMIAVLNGGMYFAVDLSRRITVPVEIDTISVSSYGAGHESNREPRILSDTKDPIEGKDVLVVEDIVDTGFSFNSLLSILRARRPASLKTCALLSKPDRREIEVPIDYLGIQIPDRYSIGEGLDDARTGRNKLGIYARRFK